MYVVFIISMQTIIFFYNPYSLLVKLWQLTGYLSSISFGNIEFLSRDYTTLPHLTIRPDQTVSVNDLSCLEHTEQSTFVTRIVAQGIFQDRIGSKSSSSVTQCKFSIWYFNFIKSDFYIHLFSKDSFWTRNHPIYG